MIAVGTKNENHELYLFFVHSQTLKFGHPYKFNDVDALRRTRRGGGMIIILFSRIFMGAPRECDNFQ